MGSRKPAKQFLELAGIPIIIHTIRAFEQCEVIDEIILVLPARDAPGFLALIKRFQLRKIAKIVTGGKTRADSVLRGLRAIRTVPNIVAVHDGVRPFVTVDEIASTVRAADQHGAAILVAPTTDTIKEVDGSVVVRTVPRSRLRHALTPQCFRYDLLRKAFEGVDTGDPQLTDESSLVEKLGVPIAFVEGSARNIKITQPEDLAIGEALLKFKH